METHTGAQFSCGLHSHAGQTVKVFRIFLFNVYMLLYKNIEYTIYCGENFKKRILSQPQERGNEETHTGPYDVPVSKPGIGSHLCPLGYGGPWDPGNSLCFQVTADCSSPAGFRGKWPPFLQWRQPCLAPLSKPARLAQRPVCNNRSLKRYRVPMSVSGPQIFIRCVIQASPMFFITSQFEAIAPELSFAAL
jgi:hypothetical protein